jgi:hypothetical protein
MNQANIWVVFFLEKHRAHKSYASVPLSMVREGFSGPFSDALRMHSRERLDTSKTISLCVCETSSQTEPFNGTLAWDFLVLVVCTDKTYIGKLIGLLSVSDFVPAFADLFEFFYIRRWLSWHRVSVPVNWVNARWDSTSTESTRNDSIFVLYINVGAFCVDSV